MYLPVITTCFVAPFQCAESRNETYDIFNISLNNFSPLFWACFSLDNEYPVSLHIYRNGEWCLSDMYISFQAFLDSFGKYKTCYIRLFNVCKLYQEPYELLIKASKRHIFIQSYAALSYPNYLPPSPFCSVNKVIASVNNRLSRIKSATHFQSQQTILLYDSPVSRARTPSSQFKYPYLSARGCRVEALKVARAAYLRNHTPSSFLFIDSAFLDSYDLNHFNISPTAETKAAYIEELSYFLHKISCNLQLQPLISIHPRSSLGLYRASFPDFRITQGDTFEILPTVTFALGHWSSAAMDVIYANIPYFTLMNSLLSSIASDSRHLGMNYVKSLECLFGIPILGFSPDTSYTSLEYLFQFQSNRRSISRYTQGIKKYFYTSLDCANLASTLSSVKSDLYL